MLERKASCIAYVLTAEEPPYTTRGIGATAGAVGCGRFKRSLAYKPMAAVSAASGIAAPSVESQSDMTFKRLVMGMNDL